MIVNFFNDGSVQHTLRDSVFKLSGHRRVDRVSEIKFHSGFQKFYIQWRYSPNVPFFQNDPPHSGPLTHTESIAREYGVEPPERCGVTGVCYFDTYELAVGHEIEVLDAMRRKGIRF